jgi:hypothetical protein
MGWTGKNGGRGSGKHVLLQPGFLRFRRDAQMVVPGIIDRDGIGSGNGEQELLRTVQERLLGHHGSRRHADDGG